MNTGPFLGHIFCFQTLFIIEMHIWLNEFYAYVVVLLFYVHGKHLRLCRDGQLT